MSRQEFKKMLISIQIQASVKYATKHKQLATYPASGHRFSFSNYWLHIFQNTSAGDIEASKYKGFPVLRFTTAFDEDYFRKKVKFIEIKKWGLCKRA